MTLEQATKAYADLEFLNSPAARTLRILAEYLEPEERLDRENVGDVVVFFGSARITSTDEAKAALEALWARDAPPGEAELRVAQAAARIAHYYDEARELARRLAALGKELPPPRHFNIATGGGPGIMEAANRGAAEAGARTIGFNISLSHEQDPNPYISPELNFEFHYFFMRKLWFAYPCHAVVVFPGGFGTLDELFEMLTLIQNGKSKPVPVVLYGKEFWDDIINLDALVRWGTISQEDLDLIHRSDDVDEAYEYLEARLKPEDR